MQDQCPPLRHLMICTPAYPATTALHYTHSLCGAMVQCLSNGIHLDVTLGGGCCYLDLIRNDLVRQFLDSPADRLLFIDADIGYPPEAVLRVANTPRPVVAGVYRKKTDLPEWPIAVETGPFHVDVVTGLIEAASVASGFLCIHRSVFEQLQPSVPYFRDDRGLWMHAYFQCLIQDGRYFGEDVVFCQRWRALGGTIWFVPDLQLTHLGEKEYTGAYHEWMNLRPLWEKIEGYNNCPNLYEMAIERAPQTGARFVEVGAWKGKSTVYLVSKILHSGKSIQVDVVDHWQGSVEHQTDPDIQAGRLREVFEANVAPVREWLIVKDGKSTDVAQDYPDEMLDFVFLDASHDAASLTADCTAWWPTVKPGGILAGDDWQWESVQQGVRQYFETLPGEYTLRQRDAGWYIVKE